jgi:myo-inositol-1(or 4)-monophosphatase
VSPVILNCTAPSNVEVAIAAVQAGAGVVARNYAGDHIRLAKSATDFATQTDVDAESAIIEVLAHHRPAHARTGEESGSIGERHASRRWLIDPLCGTSNFAAGTPLFVVNVARSANGITPAAAADPISAELFWTDSESAYSRSGEDRRLSPTAQPGLVEVNCDDQLDRAFIGGRLVSGPRLREAFRPRVISSTLGVAWVAAGIALCEASGCVVSDLAGNPLHTERGLLISADEETHQRMLALVEPHLGGLSPAQQLRGARP